MNSLHRGTEDDDVDEPLRMSGTRDREITLGTTMILGIFFALAVFAAVFFGFGYSMGAKHAAAVVAGPAESGAATFSSFKPAAGNVVAPAARPGAAAAVAPPVPFTPPPAVVTPSSASRANVRPADSVAAGDPIPAALPPTARSHTPAVEPPSAPPPAAVASVSGVSIVQVAAVSHQEDADLLVATLKRKGYAVAVHSEPQDKLLHVQIGPYAGHKEADLMRQRLQADGFNAIVKDKP